MAIASINPATGEKLKEFPPFDDVEIEKRLSRAEKAFREYRRTTFTERSEFLQATAELLFQEKKRFAQIITFEMGKLLRDSVAEIEKCARGCRFYAENGERKSRERGSKHGRARDQEKRARARWQRRVHRDAERRLRARVEHRGQSPHYQHWAIVYRGKAIFDRGRNL